MTLDVASGMEYLHFQHSLIHGDLHSRNCFVDLQKRVKVGDFGLSSTCLGVKQMAENYDVIWRFKLRINLNLNHNLSFNMNFIYVASSIKPLTLSIFLILIFLFRIPDPALLNPNPKFLHVFDGWLQNMLII